VIIKLISKEEAQQLLSNNELQSGELIDPAYADNQRVIVQWKLSPGKFDRVLATVPTGMVVHINEIVSFILRHGDPDNFCLYVPNLIVP
jgi:hypothetical protein